MEKKTFYYTSMNDRGRKNAPLKLAFSIAKEYILPITNITYYWAKYLALFHHLNILLSLKG